MPKDDDKFAHPDKDHPESNEIYAFTDLEFLNREELRPVRILLEVLKPELILNDYGIDKGVVFFGSARVKSRKEAEKQLATVETKLKKDPKNPELKKALVRAKNMLENSRYLAEASRLAEIISASSEGYVVFTGGGPGFMAAANKGAHSNDRHSVALNMKLPNEQAANPYTTPKFTFQFQYFSTRKMHFLMRAKALVAFPGGFGTMDELFETLTLLQTKKIAKIPMLLFNKRFWDHVIDFNALVEEGTISETDVDWFQFVETADEAWDIIKRFYA